MEKSITPAMQQFYEMKAEYSDCILFFRMWDFYEMFDDDAYIAHKILWIAVTSRNKNSATPTPLAWIPYHAKEKYLPLLIQAGYKVAIAEQVSDPHLKWIVKREVVRVVTPSTLELEWDVYTSLELSQNILLSISHTGEKYGLSFLDLATNKWTTWEFRDFEMAKQELYKLWVKEVVLDKNLFNNTEVTDVLTKKYSLNIFYYEAPKKPKNILLQHFWVKNLEWFWLEDKSECIASSALLLGYLRSNQKSEFSYLTSIYYDSFSGYMWLDESTIKNLDLVYNFATKSSVKWTLFWVLNKTKTSAWGRYLREQILKPLQDIDTINNRLDMVEQFVKNPMLLDSVQNELKYVADIDMILNRLALWRAMPKDLLNLKRSLQWVVNVCDIIKKSENKILISLLWL